MNTNKFWLHYGIALDTPEGDRRYYTCDEMFGRWTADRMYAWSASWYVDAKRQYEGMTKEASNMRPGYSISLVCFGMHRYELAFDSFNCKETVLLSTKDSASTVPIIVTTGAST